MPANPFGHRRHGMKTFRDGSYYAKVIVGKRTVKEGECAAIWTASGERKVIEGPRRVNLVLSHVRFLDRHTADQNQYLAVQYRDGSKEHRRGPVALFFDPCVHEKMQVKDAIKLGANEAVVVYCEEEKSLVRGEVNGASLTVAAASKAEVATGVKVAGVGERGVVLRRIVQGPAVFIPGASEWVHTFDWHGSISGGRGSKTGSPGDEKVPHALSFQKLRCMPDSMYYSVRDVRTTDDAQVTIHLMLFYVLENIEQMLDSTNDPIGDWINATSADVITWGACNTYETLLERTAQLSEIGTFPLLRGRMAQTGYQLLKVVYRGYSTSGQLQGMHEAAINERTKLKLKSDTLMIEQEQQARELQGKEARSQRAMAVAEAEVRHRVALKALEKEAERAVADETHKQKLRHAAEAEKMRLEHSCAAHDEELRRYGALKSLGVDLTKYMCVVDQAKPDQHLRIETAPAGAPPVLHLGFNGRS